MDILQNLLDTGGALDWILATLGALILGRFIARIPYEWARGLVARAWDAIVLIVKDVKQTYVDAIKASRDPAGPGGAKITSDEAAKARAMAWGKFSRMGVSRWLSVALWILGFGKKDDWFRTATEAVVRDTNVLEAQVKDKSRVLPPLR